MSQEETELTEHAVRLGVPERLIGGLLRYALKGIRPGHFLTAVLENNLSDAIGRADDESMAALKPIVLFVYNYLPAPCWGSPDKVKEWRGQC